MLASEGVTDGGGAGVAQLVALDVQLPQPGVLLQRVRQHHSPHAADVIVAAVWEQSQKPPLGTSRL